MKTHRRLPGRSPLPALRSRRGQRGQGLLEFALVAPLMVLLAVGLGDFGRIFSVTVALESGAREAADYGAFLGSDAWADAASPWTTNKAAMALRACTAMSKVWGYDNSSGTCTINPVFSAELCESPNGGSVPADGTCKPPLSDCGGRTGLVSPCLVHVHMTFDFHPIVTIPPFPSTVTLTRDVWFAVTDLPSS